MRPLSSDLASLRAYEVWMTSNLGEELFAMHTSGRTRRAESNRREPRGRSMRRREGNRVKHQPRRQEACLRNLLLKAEGGRIAVDAAPTISTEGKCGDRETGNGNEVRLFTTTRVCVGIPTDAVRGFDRKKQSRQRRRGGKRNELEDRCRFQMQASVLLSRYYRYVIALRPNILSTGP